MARATFGDLVTPFAIERLIMGQDQKVIVGIISKTIEIVKVHFIPGIGFVQCFEGQCCADHGLPSVRNGLPIMKYTTDGKMTITGDEMDFMMLSIGNTDYKDLMTKDEILKSQGSDLTKKDLLVTCTDSTYQKKKFDVLGDAKWRKLMTQELFKEKMTLFVNNANVTFGRVVDLPTYQGLMAALVEAPVADRPSADALRRQPPAKTTPARVAAKPSPVATTPTTAPGPTEGFAGPEAGETSVEAGAVTVDVSDLDFESLVE